MTTPRLLLIRHAEVEEQFQGVFGGRIDMNLSRRGHEQAAALARYLQTRQVDALYASPMKRVQQTLSPFLRNGTPPPESRSELRELDFGDWTGLTFAEVKAQFGVAAEAWLDQFDRDRIPNAETRTACQARVATCLREIRQRHAAGTTAVFCHGGVTRVILALLLKLPLARTAAFAIDYASITEVAFKPHRPELQLLNFTPWRLPTS